MLDNNSSDIGNRISQHFAGIRMASSDELLREADAKISELEKALKNRKDADAETSEELSGILGSIEAWLDPAPKQQTAIFETMARVKDQLAKVRDKLSTRS